MTPMLAFALLLVLALAGFALAGYAWVLERRRRLVLERALGDGEARGDRPAILRGNDRGAAERLGAKLERWLPQPWRADPRTREKLLRGGYEGEHAATIFVAARVALLVAMPAAAVLLFRAESLDGTLLRVAGAVLLAWVIPAGIVDGAVRRRQERLRRAIPDALDLLLVCVEAGSSLELGIQRVSRELRLVHPELADELAGVVRRIKAGIPRADALKQLHLRTGVDELRTIATSIIQSEKWGTSITRVLRVTAETLRRKRRQSAERRAQTAPVRMTLPLVTMILPALFMTLLGPAVITILQTLRN
jgi:tight adherence protein C